MQQCDAISRQTGERCRRTAVPGKNKCRYHGGAALSGPLSKRYKHGKYSKYAPPQLLERYHEALDDPELLSLRDSVALTTARIAEILANFDEAQPAEFWQQLHKYWSSFMGAVRARDAKEQAEYVARIDELVTRAVTYSNMWDELERAMEQQRKLVESEQRRLISANQMISVTEAMVMITQLVSLVKESITDIADKTTANVILSRINQGYVALLNVPAPEVVDGEYQNVEE